MWEKEKLLVMSNFSFSHSVLYSIVELPAIFVRQNCHLRTLSFWKSLQLVVWERVIGYFQPENFLELLACSTISSLFHWLQIHFHCKIKKQCGLILITKTAQCGLILITKATRVVISKERVKGSVEAKNERGVIDCLGFYPVLTVFQLFNSMFPELFLNQYLASPLS